MFPVDHTELRNHVVNKKKQKKKHIGYIGYCITSILMTLVVHPSLLFISPREKILLFGNAESTGYPVEEVFWLVSE